MTKTTRNDRSSEPSCRLLPSMPEAFDDLRMSVDRFCLLAGLEPHSLRHMLAHLAYSHCRSPEAVKAWSQNLGHESPLTTFTSYGTIATERQGELVRTAHPVDADTDILQRIRSLVTQ